MKKITPQDTNMAPYKDQIAEKAEKARKHKEEIDAACEWHPATELPEPGHWYKVRGDAAHARGYAILVNTEWGSLDWVMYGFLHLNTKDMQVTEWRCLTDEEKKPGRGKANA